MASLRDLGLSEYEARAYRALLKTGPTTAKELSRVSDVPMGRIYDVLNSIEQYNLVRSQSASRPKKYVAVEGETALERLLEDKKQELEEKEEQYERIVDELAGELESADPVEESFWTAAVGHDETTDLLVERVSSADNTLVVVGSNEGSQFDFQEEGELLTEGVLTALDRGVEVKVLMRPALVEQVAANIDDEYAEELATYDNFAARLSENVSGTFYIVDDTEVCIEVPHPLNAESTFAMIDLKDREFAANIRSEFDPRWEDADPLNL